MLPVQLKTILEAEINDHDLTQSDILQHWLGNSDETYTRLSQNSTALGALQDAIIVGLDAEWFEHDPAFITELGVCVLDPRAFSASANKSPWLMLSTLETHHVRIKPNAHLINKDFCPGHPDDFRFGTTSFIDMPTAKDMLESIFVRHDDYGNPRPVIFLGHAIDNDYTIIKERFGLDIERLGTIVATLDTQILAREQGLASPGRQLRLSHLLELFDLKEPCLHNAGNDIVCALLAALHMACPSSSSSIGSSNSSTTSASSSYKKLQSHLMTTRGIVYGSLFFCERCDAEDHAKRHCRAKDLHCAHCAADSVRVQLSAEHNTNKCVYAAKNAAEEKREAQRAQRNAVPCLHCMESTDMWRNEGAWAYGHRAEECPY